MLCNTHYSLFATHYSLFTIIQNKPNFRKAKMKLSFYSTRDYENQGRLPAPGKQTQSNPISKAKNAAKKAKVVGRFANRSYGCLSDWPGDISVIVVYLFSLADFLTVKMVIMGWLYYLNAVRFGWLWSVVLEEV